MIDRWAAVFSANDVAAVVSLYASDAVVLGTVSPTIAQGTDAIRTYFSRLSGSGSKVAIGERRTIVVSDATWRARDSTTSRPRDGRAHHHSSFRPKPQ